MTHTVLVVDDDADTRRILRYVLSPAAAIVEAAAGSEALQMIESERPALVLLDLVMPGIDGLEVLEKALKRDPRLPVIMLTGRTDIAVAKTALELGARAYITKPIEPQRLRETVEDILGTSSPGGGDDRRKPWRVVG